MKGFSKPGSLSFTNQLLPLVNTFLKTMSNENTFLEHWEK